MAINLKIFERDSRAKSAITLRFIQLISPLDCWITVDL